MKKDAIRAIACIAIPAVLYILLAFLIPFVHTAAFWISFAFGFVAIAVAAGSVYYAFMKKPDAKSRFYGFPLARIGVVYFALQIAVSLIVMALAKWIPGWIPGVAYAIGLGVALIGLISAEVVVEEIEKQDAQLKKDVSLMRDLQSKISHIAAHSENDAIKALAEEFRYSDPVSSEAIADAEADLAAAVDELQAAYIDGDESAVAQLCRKTSALLSERARLCKLNK